MLEGRDSSSLRKRAEPNAQRTEIAEGRLVLVLTTLIRT